MTKQVIAAIHCGTGAEGLRVRQELQDWAERQDMSLSGLVKALAEFDVQLEDVFLMALRRDDNITTKTLTDIYQCLREEGRSVRGAYEQTLLIHLSACEEASI